MKAVIRTSSSVWVSVAKEILIRLDPKRPFRLERAFSFALRQGASRGMGALPPTSHMICGWSPPKYL